MIHAIIDIGSNSVRMSVYQCEGKKIHFLMQQKRTVGLAGCVENNLMTKEGSKKAADTINEFAEIAKAFQIKSISAFATASLRNISNQEQVLQEIKEASGILPEIISGETEARMDFKGATHFLKLEDGILTDIGGGSTELVLFRNRMPLNISSFPIGSLKLYVEHVSNIFPNKQERKEIKKHIRSEFDKLCWKPVNEITLLCAVGGTARAFQKLCTELFAVEHPEKGLDAEYLEELHRMLKQEDPEMRRQFYKVVPERILNIQPGLMILRETVRFFGTKKIIVSPYGVREGYLIERILPE